MGSLTGSITDKEWGDFIEAWAKSELGCNSVTVKAIVKFCLDNGFFEYELSRRGSMGQLQAMSVALRDRGLMVYRGYLLRKVRADNGSVAYSLEQWGEAPVPCVSLENSEAQVLNLADPPKEPVDFFTAVLPMLKGYQVDSFSIRNGVFDTVLAIRFEKEWLPRKEGE